MKTLVPVLLAMFLLTGCELMPQRQVFTTEHSYVSTRKPSVQFNIPSDFISLSENTYDKYQRYSNTAGGTNITNNQHTWLKVGKDSTVNAAVTTNDIESASKTYEWYSLKKWLSVIVLEKKRQINGTYFEVCALPTSDSFSTAGWEQVANSRYNVPECSNSALIQYIPLTSQYTKLLIVYSEPVSCDTAFNKADGDKVINNAIKALGGS